MSSRTSESSRILPSREKPVPEGSIPASQAGPEKAAWELHPFGSNAVRLTARQWVVTSGILIALYFGLPRSWTLFEPFRPGLSYRIPYDLSNDYWLFGRYAGEVANADRIAVVGDSFVWGHYVAPDETLSACLNTLTKESHFANLGIDGIHPVALAGLLEHYAGSVRGRKVVLHFNPLWMSSRRRDLQDPRATRFNHPKLVPQFLPRIPSYRAPYGERLDVVIARESLFLTWAAHLRQAYFQGRDIPSWTLEHPYDDPFESLAARVPDASTNAPDQPLSWTDRELRQERFSWVPLEESLQWAFFKRSIRTLEDRRNEVFVLVGPFNEHMLTEENRGDYRKLLAGIETWLNEHRVNHLAFPLLPSQDYADASHPLACGYASLAQTLVEDKSFAAFLTR